MKFLFALLPFAFCLLCVSCKKNPEQKLIGKWQEVAIINPQLDEAVHNQQVFADTVGSLTDSTQNVALYGTNNIDTMKARLKENLDSFRKAQFYAVKETWFDFRKGGLMYLHSDDGLDSSSWYLDEDGALILDEAKLKGAGSKIRMEILSVTDTLLKLQFTEQYLTSTAIFKPVKK